MLPLVLVSCFLGVSGFLNPYPRNPDMKAEGKNVGQKVIITPYIENGKIDEVKRLISVSEVKGNITSYSGFVTVDKNCDSNMFFWFFPAEISPEKAPVTVWLQGGPGASSLFGLFIENGPFQLLPSNKLALRTYAWTKVTSVLYIDNPVGTGFSYAKTESCYSKNQNQVGQNLLIAIKQILQLFPTMKNNPFFVTGESYAGKYVPALSYAIHKDKDPKNKIKLGGLAIGNGLVDPYRQLHYSEYLYYLGLIDEHGRDYMKKEEDRCRALIDGQKWADAYDCFDMLLNGDSVEGKTYFHNVTGFENYFNYLHATPEPQGDLAAYLTKNTTRMKIHVGDATFHDSKMVEKNLKEDVMKSVKPWLEELLENYRVLIYNGQLDIIVGYPLSKQYLKDLKWSAAQQYKTAERHIWRVDKEVAGYVKTAGKLTEVLVRDAGHMVPADQPKWALDLISRFLVSKPYY